MKKESKKLIPFPKLTVNVIIKTLRKKGYSYRQIQEIFKMEGYEVPSLGYISNILNK